MAKCPAFKAPLRVHNDNHPSARLTAAILKPANGSVVAVAVAVPARQLAAGVACPALVEVHAVVAVALGGREVLLTAALIPL